MQKSSWRMQGTPFKLIPSFSIGSYVSSKNVANLSHWLPLKKFEKKFLGNWKQLIVCPKWPITMRLEIMDLFVENL